MRLIAETILAGILLLSPPSVLGFSTAHFPTGNPPLKQSFTSLSSQNLYELRSPSLSSSSTSSLFRRKDSSPMNTPLRSRSSFTVTQRRRWVRQISTARAALSSSSSSSSEQDPLFIIKNILPNCLDYLQTILRVCDRPLSQLQQWSILLAFYFFHLMVLSQHTILLGWQLIPNPNGHFCSVGWDSVIGIMFFALWIYIKRGSVYFRTPWRRLIADSLPDKNKTKQTYQYEQSQQLTIAEKTAAANEEVNMIASKVLEKLPRTQLLKRSEPATKKSEMSPMENFGLLSRGIDSTLANKTDEFIRRKADGTIRSKNNTTKAGISADEEQESRDNIFSSSGELSFHSASRPIPASAKKIATQTISLSTNSTRTGTTTLRSSPQVTPRQEDITVEFSKVNGNFLATNANDIAETTEHKDANGQSSTENADQNQPISPETSQLSTMDELSERVIDAFKKGLQQQFEKIKVVPTSGSNSNSKNTTRISTTQGPDNTTRISTQGPDLSDLTLPTPEQRRYMLPRGTSLVACLLLVKTYFFTGRFSFFWEDTLYAMAGVGFPLTVAMHRSLCVLLGHLTWVAAGSAILRIVVRPKFFGPNNKWYRQFTRPPVSVTADDKSVGSSSGTTMARGQRSSGNWIWWVIGGYSVSAWLFNVADFANLYALPAQVLEDAILQEGVVTQLINPENRDFLASLVGYIAPCLTAPWWEEILYRGFFFPALSLLFPVWFSVFFSGIIFSAHHLSMTAALPLAVLGWTWCGLYMASDNLWTTILVHGLWNSRVFLSSWLGL